MRGDFLYIAAFVMRARHVAPGMSPMDLVVRPAITQQQYHRHHLLHCRGDHEHTGVQGMMHELAHASPVKLGIYVFESNGPVRRPKGRGMTHVYIGTRMYCIQASLCRQQITDPPRCRPYSAQYIVQRGASGQVHDT
jgi:hypothetical protein